MTEDERYMRVALAEAEAAFQAGEVPVGAVIVSETGRILARAHNLTESLRDTTAHAEMLAITAAQDALGGKSLQDCTLYVTLEPCPMCAGAVGLSRLSRVVVGTSDPKRGYSTILREGASPFHPKATTQWGVLAEESIRLLQTFFRSRR